MESQLKRRLFGAFCVVAGVFSFINFACDKGLDADFFKGTVRGELQINTVVPDTTDEMRVVLAKNFPFEDLQSVLISNRLVPAKDPNVTTQRIPYEIIAPLGEYDAALVIWKAKAQSIQLTDIVGLYGNLERLELTPIILTEENQVADNINIPIDFSRVNRTSSIQGQITFVGEWPSNTQIVALVAYRDFNDFGKIPPGLVFIPTGVEEFSYRVGITPGTYQFVFVAWLPLGQFDLNKLRILGVYEDPSAPGQAGTLVVPDSTDVTDVNIVADFANIDN